MIAPSRAATALALAVVALSSSGCSTLHDSLNKSALFPKPDYELWPDEVGLDAEDVFVPVDHLRLHGWLVTVPQAKATVVVFHGNYPNSGPYLLWVKALHSAGFNSLLVNYRGYGASEGEPDLWSLRRDGEAIGRWVDSRPELAKLPLGVLGVSLGTMVALATAEACPRVGAVVLDSPFLPRRGLKRALGSFFGTVTAPFLLPDDLDSEALAAQLERPLLVIHGVQDDIAEPISAVEIYRKARGPKFLWLAPDAGHSPGVAGFYDGIYESQVRAFFDAWLVGTATRPWLAVDWRESERTVHVAPRLVRGEVKAPVPVEVCVAYRREDADEPGFLWRRWSWEPGKALDLTLAGEPLAVSLVAFAPEEVQVQGGGFELAFNRYARSDRLVMPLVFYVEKRAELEAALATDLDPSVLPQAASNLYHASYIDSEFDMDRPKARATLRRALALQPADLHCCRILGNAYWQLSVHPLDVARIHRRLLELLDPGETVERAVHEKAIAELEEQAKALDARQAARMADVRRRRDLAPRE